jgi:hypothetical protein
MNTAVAIKLPVFAGEAAETFVLGCLWMALESRVSFHRLKELVLWQWNDSSLFRGIELAVCSLEERGIVTKIGTENPDTWQISLVRR